MSSQWTANDEDVNSLAWKLAEFSKTLSPGEQAAWQERIQRDWSQDDVQGYAAWSPEDANWWQSWWKAGWQE